MRRHCLTLGTALVLATLAASSPARATRPLTPRISTPVRHDTSPPLRSMRPLTEPRPGADRVVPNKVPVDLAARHKPTATAPDPLRQTREFPVASGASTPAPTINVPGLSDDDNSATVGFRIVPPDTEGDVGPDHYVQFNNLILAVWDKSGSRIFGPVPGNTIWAGFGGDCETSNDGDPIVLYDHLADRWVVSQFAIGADGHECIAVSTTGDPTGSYHRYDFVVSPGAFNDYPKLGVWPDGYYMSANEFAGSGGSGGFAGAVAVAFERDKMLAGLAAQMVKFGPLPCASECFFALQPSHLEGPAPASGTPNTFLMAFDDETWGTGGGPDGYRLWDFSVDWTAPSSSTFTAGGQVDTSEFDANLCNFTACVPQFRGEKLDTLSVFTMYRAQFRHFADHDTILVNHTVDASGSNTAGIRWAELRNTGSGWFLFQSGTYAPADGLHRWMGSIAMDGDGDIALGYSTSSSRTFPSVRYVTRIPSDPLGQMPGGEVELVAGTGSQRQSFNRWGDYSAMSVDPADDCTFWYTQEYYANSGRFDFKTRIGSFKLPSCGSGCTVTENPEISCSDGLDNDCDGLIDGADPDCSGCTVTENPEISCSDGLDNDCDGLIDGDDPDCQGCTLGQVGDPCTKNSDCCTDFCAGRRRRKTCQPACSLGKPGDPCVTNADCCSNRCRNTRRRGRICR